MKKLLSILTITTLTASIPAPLIANTIQPRVKRDVSPLTFKSNNGYLPIKIATSPYQKETINKTNTNYQQTNKIENLSIKSEIISNDIYTNLLVVDINTEFVEEIDENINFNNNFKIFYVTKYNSNSKDVENDLKEILKNNGHTLYILPESEKNNSSTTVINSIYREIEKADYVIVNISKFFAKDIQNVWIELGLSLGMKKDKVLIIHNSEEVKEKNIPSDIKGLWRLEYNSIDDLRKKIMNELQKNIFITSKK